MIPNERLLGSASSSGPRGETKIKTGRPTDRPTDPRVFSITDWIRAIAAPRSNEPRISIRWLARGFMHALWPSAGAQSAVKVSGQRRPATCKFAHDSRLNKKKGRTNLVFHFPLLQRDIEERLFPGQLVIIIGYWKSNRLFNAFLAGFFISNG